MADSGGALVKAFGAHYTNRHTGVCLEFETGTVFFAEAARVIYREEYPAMPLRRVKESSIIDRGRSLGPVSRTEPEVHHCRQHDGLERTGSALGIGEAVADPHRPQAGGQDPQ